MADSTAKIIIVDDEELLRESLKDFLEDLDYLVNTAGSIKETIEIVENNKPDLIVVDMNLPDGNGGELIRKIADKYSEIKYIIHTGENPYIISEFLSEIGITAENIIYKPFKDLSEFVNKVESLLKK